MITLPRPLLVALGVGFSLYHLVLGISALVGGTHYRTEDLGRVVIALALYLVATGLSVTVGRRVEMPVWLAGLNVGIALSITLLVASSLKPGIWIVSMLNLLVMWVMAEFICRCFSRVRRRR